MNVAPLAKTLILLGVLVALVGILLLIMGRLPFAGRLPGDILIKHEHLRIYFPITTCLVVSLILTVIARFFNNK